MRKRQISLLLSFALITSVLVPGVYHFSQKANINFYRAERFFEVGLYEDAITFYQKAFKKVLKRIKRVHVWAIHIYGLMPPIKPGKFSRR